MIASFAAYPVGYWSDAVGRYNEEGEVVLEERRAEDDEEEADSEDLCTHSISVVREHRLAEAVLRRRGR